jgi:hypothetical protein
MVACRALQGFGLGARGADAVLLARRVPLGSTLQATDEIYWMAHDLTWCRCADGWYRLGEYETEVPMYLEGFT